MTGGPINTTPDMDEGYPEEWETLERKGTGDGLLTVEWDAVSNTVRVSGPVIQVERPVRPA
jgi:hypothetical protein